MFKRSLLAMSVLVSSAATVFSSPDPDLNYSYIYFENGYPTRLVGRRPQSEANLAARANPDLVFQTGYYSLMLDCDDVSLKGYDALAGSNYRSALHQDATVFTPASGFLLRVYQDGVAYDCDSAVIQDAGYDYVRLNESGQFLQRIDHLGLIFKDAGGNPLTIDEGCRLEVSAWPDRVTFMLDFSSETNNPVERTTIQVVSPDGVSHMVDEMTSLARLTIKPQDDVKLMPLDPNDYITGATDLQHHSALDVFFDEDVHAFHIDVPADAVRYPSGNDRVDEYIITVTNASASVENIPLIFNHFRKDAKPNLVAATGTAMLLSDADSDRPLGIPVQISKDWDASGIADYGPFMRGATMLTLQPGENRRFKLRVVYGYWGGAGAVSHAHASLVGWGGHWKWDISTLGAWGESLTYDPSQHLGSAFLDDIRPAFTLSMDDWTPYADNNDTNIYNWTENTGGGDFLVYRDSSDTYRWLKRIKTCYYQTGPSMAEVYYSGVTDDNKIRVTYTSRMSSTLDYHRHFHDYRYEFLQDVIAPQRLVFHQIAGDWYHAAVFTNYYVGDETGMLVAGTIEAGGNAYKGSPVPFDGRWLSIDDTHTVYGDDQARALRGIIPLSSSLNGSPFPLYIHKYGRTWGAPTMLFDLSSDSVNRSYNAGDVVEGEIEFIMPPQHLTNYWGGDAELENRLASYGDTAWEPVRDEFVHNVQMSAEVHQGTLLRSYPLEIVPQSGSAVLTDFTVNGGGIGHVPVVLKGADPGLELTVQRLLGGVWTDLESVDLENNTYYQAVLNADGTADYAFNIPRPSLDLNDAWRIRICIKASGWGYQDSFESGFGQWVNSGADHMEWTWRSGRTPSGGTGPDGASDGNYYVFTEATGNQGRTAILAGSFALGAYSNREMMFDYHMYGDGGMGSMHVDVFDGTVWHTAVWSVSGTQHTSTGDPWSTATIDLAPYVPAEGTVDVRIRAIVGPGFKSDIAVDNIRLAAQSSWLPYEKWVSDFMLTGSNTWTISNPDNDMYNNLYEYGLGGDPTNASWAGYVPTVELVSQGGSNVVEYTYARRVGAEDELIYYLELTDNLVGGSWTNSGYEEIPVAGEVDAGFEAVTNRVGTAGKSNEFIRLRIEVQ